MRQLHTTRTLPSLLSEAGNAPSDIRYYGLCIDPAIKVSAFWQWYTWLRSESSFLTVFSAFDAGCTGLIHKTNSYRKKKNLYDEIFCSKINRTLNRLLPCGIHDHVISFWCSTPCARLSVLFFVCGNPAWKWTSRRIRVQFLESASLTARYVCPDPRR